jgi:hypothetical protein
MQHDKTRKHGAPSVKMEGPMKFSRGRNQPNRARSIERTATTTMMMIDDDSDDDDEIIEKIDQDDPWTRVELGQDRA